ncbi:protein CHUP1, chloroplastic-like [Vigna umbellata]|uniref:protein CHUP1, chloroplastic-like n=1 Tax=Vigna umbellata TaxID=87088 RepID=UPI001F5FE361|nr:protein CHUP1, chloroplastic-like [Vigna umbellata]
MREEKENPSENRSKVSKLSDQNQPPKPQTTKGTNPNNNGSKTRLWGAHIVKGFSADKKAKPFATKKQTLTSSTATSENVVVANQKSNGSNPFVPSHSRVKRSLIGDLSCSINPAQVHPHAFPTHRRQSSTDLFTELDHMRGLLQESKERECKLNAELAECRKRVSEVDEIVKRVGLLEQEKVTLTEQLAALTCEEVKGEVEQHKEVKVQNLELEVVELRRLNKELQMQKRNLTCRLSSIEAQSHCPDKSSESDVVAKIKAEASLLRVTNEDLCKQVEGLQISRLNEVEELAYLRWVNSCLRNELKNTCSALDSDKPSSPHTVVSSSGDCVSSFSDQANRYLNCGSANRFNMMKKPKKWPITSQEEFQGSLIEKNCIESDVAGGSPRRRHSISGSNYSEEEVVLSKRRQSDYFVCSKEMEKESVSLSFQQSGVEVVQRPQYFGNCQETNKLLVSSDVEKRALRIPNPPPRPSCSISSKIKQESSAQVLPPPPPPPPPPPMNFASKSNTATVKRAPQVVELYHSLMKRDSRKDSSNGGLSDAPDVADVRSSMIGEIENRSSHLLAIKADIETQGEFVNSLIREVKNAVYQNIEDVVAFVKWLDDELCFLVDERAVLKHFDWPEKKADTLREAAFGYQDLKKLESEVYSYKDDPRLPCDIALKKMVALSEKMERTVHNLLRTRESLMRHCKEFQIPIEWMLDNGTIGKIKLSSVKLAKKYMKRVAMELQVKSALEKDPAMDYMLLQGVRFAFRIHQFAGGFDAETMHAFEELRNLASLLNKT